MQKNDNKGGKKQLTPAMIRLIKTESDYYEALDSAIGADLPIENEPLDNEQ